jgi:hypothetical protein
MRAYLHYNLVSFLIDFLNLKFVNSFEKKPEDISEWDLSYGFFFDTYTSILTINTYQ